MRILMLSWEYPPVSVGGLARHVRYLSRELARRGHEVDVITQGEGEAGDPSAAPGPSNAAAPGFSDAFAAPGALRVHRRKAWPLAAPDFLHWVHQLNYSFLEAILGMVARGDASGPAAAGVRFDIVHAHDWLVAFAARAAKHALRVPLVATIHATEAGRHGGIHNPWQRYISEVEWWLTYEAWRVIGCSEYMASELGGQFRLPADKLRVIPNGIDPADVATATAADPGPAVTREAFAAPGEEVVVFVGRLVREKGVDTLLAALPAVLERRPGLRLVVAGTGPAEDHLRLRAAAAGLADRVTFTGYLADGVRNHLYAAASVAVVPSLYEPFGISALEAMACGVPLVVSDTGGLAEIVRHGETGLKVPPSDPEALAGAIVRLLADRALAGRLTVAARSEVEARYCWSEVAARTEEAYLEVLEEGSLNGWSGLESRPPSGEDWSGDGCADGRLDGWSETRRHTRVMTRGLEPIGRYNPPS